MRKEITPGEMLNEYLRVKGAMEQMEEAGNVEERIVIDITDKYAFHIYTSRSIFLEYYLEDEFYNAKIEDNDVRQALRNINKQLPTHGQHTEHDI